MDYKIKKDLIESKLGAKKIAIPFDGYWNNTCVQVWSADITYLKIFGLAAIIDWHSKNILSYKIANTMDSKLVIDVLTEALNTFGAPENFNTDHVSVYKHAPITPTYYLSMVYKYRWMEKTELLIIWLSKGFGVVRNMIIFIFKSSRQ